MRRKLKRSRSDGTAKKISEMLKFSDVNSMEGIRERYMQTDYFSTGEI